MAIFAAVGVVSAAGYAFATPLVIRAGLPALAAHVIVFGVLFVLYLVAVRTVRTAPATGQALATILGFALLFRLLLLATPVYLSSDVYRYLWDGRVQRAGISPYRHPPAAAELAHLRDDTVHANINRPGARTVYPPGAQWLFALAAVVAPTLVAWRLLLVMFEAATIALLLRALPRLGVAPTAVLVYAWSPLVVFEGAQAGHLEVAVIPVILLALCWRQSGSSAGAGFILGLAVLMKLYPALFVPAWWRPGDWRFPAAVAATVGTAYLPYAASLGLGALGFLPEYFGRAEDHNIGLRGLVQWFAGFDDATARPLLVALFFVLLLAFLIRIGALARGRELWRASALAVAAYLLLVPTSMHPWYVVLMVPFLVVQPSPAWLYFTGAVTLSYLFYVLPPVAFGGVWAAQWLPLVGLLLIAGSRAVRRQGMASWGTS